MKELPASTASQEGKNLILLDSSQSIVGICTKLHFLEKRFDLLDLHEVGATSNDMQRSLEEKRFACVEAIFSVEYCNYFAQNSLR